MKRSLKQHLYQKEQALLCSEKDLKSIYDIMFSTKDKILCEWMEGFRICRCSYEEMRLRIEEAAKNLYAKIGSTHSFVALEMENCPDWIVAFWAILRSGNKPYLVNMRYPDSLTNGILKTLEISYIVCLSESTLHGESIILSSLPKSEADIPSDAFEDEIAFSSSATSMNEVVCIYTGQEITEQILDFRSIVKNGPRIAKHYKSSLKQLAFLPFYHVFGLFAVYFWFTFFGRTLVFLKDYSADTILKTCRKHEVTHIFAVPMFWHTIEKQVYATAAEGGEKRVAKLKKGIKMMNALQDIFPNLGAFVAKRVMSQVTSKLFGNSVMFCISGGSYVRDGALELLNGLGYSLYNGYGMSEIGISSVELRKKARQRNENSIGRPFDSVEYLITDEGELLVRGTSLCRKKITNGVAADISDWFHTGDIVEERDGNYFILGRMGDMVIGENGENLNPDTIEKSFSFTSAIAISVLGMQGEDGEELSLVAQIGPYSTPEQTAALTKELYDINQTLPLAYGIRKFYFTFDEMIPPTAVKVSRTQLLSKIQNGTVNLIPFREISEHMYTELDDSPLVVEVKQIIANSLGISVEEIHLSSHILYDLGATSIQYFTILSALAKHFSLSQFSSSDAYCYTVEEIAKYIEGHI